jgi:acetolactate synthase-1/2/3 large subunit
MSKMTGGQAVVESLIAQGITTVFGIISIHTLSLYDALREAVSDGRMKFIGGRHEHAVSFMADGYARATGKPGVVLTSSGPGASDSVGAIGESYHSSIPVLQITTEVEQDNIQSGKGVLHEAKDQAGMFTSITGWQGLAKGVGDIPNHIAEAMENMRTKHPRPGVLHIPTDLLGMEADVEIIPERDIPRATADPSAIEKAVGLLANATRPAIIVGNGVMNATAELRQLAERLQIPVTGHDSGKGAFPDDHPLGLGSALVGRRSSSSPVHEYLPTCDVVLVVGASLSHRSTKNLGLELNGAIIQVDIDPQMMGRNYPVAVGLVGDAKAILQQLVSASAHVTVRRSSDHLLEIGGLKSQVSTWLDQDYPNERRLWDGIRSVLDRDAVVVSDSAMAGYAGHRCFQALEPRTFHHPHGWVSIGYGFAGSLGAKAGLPERQVVCVTGDGGFQYNLQELGTAVQYGIAPVVLIFNDNAWGVLEQYQTNRFSGRYFATNLVNPDFQRLASAYGIKSAQVSSIDQMVSELKRAVKSDTIQLIEVLTPDGIQEFE